jgi:hypothetical protein
MLSFETFKCAHSAEGVSMILAFRAATIVLALVAVSSVVFVDLARAQASAALKPQVIKVGDTVIDGSFLKPYKNAWKIVYTFPGKDPMLVGAWTDELAAIDVHGRSLLKRTQMADYAKYNIVTSYVNVFDPKTLAPISQDFRRSDTGEWAHRDFDKSRVRYQRDGSKEKGKNGTGQIELNEAIFDYNGGMYGVLLAALPLHEGLTAELPTLSEDRDELDHVLVKVGKQELVDAGPGKQVLAWRVDTEENYANQSHSIFWVTKEPPYVIKLVTVIPTGNWVTVTISMI